MSGSIPHTEQARALLYHARAATPFSSTTGEPCASIPSSLDSRRVLPLRSAEFRDWLTGNYYSEYETAPSASAVRAALRTLEARARYPDSAAEKIDYRLSFEGDPFIPSKVTLDLANAAGEIVEITSRGWSVASNFGQCFREFPSMLPLPSPQQTGAEREALQKMTELFRLTDANRVRILTWIAAALRPIGPYPILVLQGPVSSGKSVLARALRALIDPSRAPLRPLPARSRELFQAAFQNWVLAFDHVHRVPVKIAEALCALSSGDALEIAQHDARGPLVFQIARPTILIAPQDESPAAWIPPRSLSNRTLTIDLAPIAALRPEAAIWSAFEELRPAALAALCTAVATALHRIRDVDIGNAARFPDCAAWAAAAAPALGLEQVAILETLADPASIWIGADPLRDALYALLRQNPAWNGDASTLLHQLRTTIPFAALPSTAKGLSQAISRVPGISIARTRGPQGQRWLSIARTAGTSSQTAASDASIVFAQD